MRARAATQVTYERSWGDLVTCFCTGSFFLHVNGSSVLSGVAFTEEGGKRLQLPHFLEASIVGEERMPTWNSCSSDYTYPVTSESALTKAHANTA